MVVGVGDGDALPLPQTERQMICDPLQLKACEAMLLYCGNHRKGTAHPQSMHIGCPRASGDSRAPWQTYGVPSTCYSTVPIPLDVAVEDPDERPYIWDLED